MEWTRDFRWVKNRESFDDDKEERDCDSEIAAEAGDGDAHREKASCFCSVTGYLWILLIIS